MTREFRSQLPADGSRVSLQKARIDLKGTVQILGFTLLKTASFGTGRLFLNSRLEESLRFLEYGVSPQSFRQLIHAMTPAIALNRINDADPEDSKLGAALHLTIPGYPQRSELKSSLLTSRRHPLLRPLSN